MRNKRNKMSKKSRHELAEQIQSRYLKVGKHEKKWILNEFVENTGYHRKTAIQLLHSDLRPQTYKKKPGRKRKYSNETSNYICGQRHQPYLPELIEILGG